MPTSDAQVIHALYHSMYHSMYRFMVARDVERLGRLLDDSFVLAHITLACAGVCQWLQRDHHARA